MDYDFEKFFNLSLDMLCIAGTDGYLKRVNRAFERTLGWTTEQLLARPVIEFVHPEDVELTRRELTRLAEGKPTVSFDNRCLLPDGSYRNLHWTAYPDPQAQLIYASARDITSRIRDRERFRLALEASPSPLVMIDSDGSIVLVNQATECLFGYDRDRLCGRSIEMLLPERLHGRHLQLRARFAESAASLNSVRQFTLTAVKEDGAEFPVEVSLRPFDTENGSYVLAALTDLTERVRAAQELSAAAQELERSNQELEQFAYVASHDLQEPLRMVAGYTQLLARRYGEQLGEEALEFVDYAVEGVTRMQQLINDLLSYSRVQARGRSFEPVRTSDAVDWALRNLELVIQETGTEVTQDELPTVLGDPAQIRQLFQNLISNAIKFRGERPPRVHITAHPDGVHWVLSVRDNGIGIDESHRQEVFQIFRRLHTHEEYEGTGIGLAVCKRIVERHGGTIWCESAPEGGSIFLFTIPSTATEEPTSPEAAEQTPESTSPSRTERSRTRATPRSLVGS